MQALKQRKTYETINHIANDRKIFWFSKSMFFLVTRNIRNF